MADPIIIELQLDGSKGVDGAFSAIVKKGEEAGNKVEKAFSNKLSNGFDNLNKRAGSLIPKITALTSAAIGFATALVFDRGIEASNAQQDAINKLNTSLKLAGSFSNEASVSMLSFASALENTTTFSGDAIIQQIALARNFTKTNDEAVKLVKTAADLSAATGVSLDTAVAKLGKTLAGTAGNLGDTIPVIKSFTEEQLKAGDAIDLVSQRFGGAASQSLNTFSGASQSLSNAIGGLFEQIGNLVTNSPELLNFLKIGVKSVSDSIKEFGSTFNLFDDVVVKLFPIADFFANTLAPTLEFASNLFISFGRAALNVVNTIAAELTALFGAIGAQGAKIAQFFGVSGEVVNSLIAFGETSRQVADENFDALENSFDGLFDFPVSETLAQKNVELQEGLAKFVETSRAAKEQQSLQNQEIAAKAIEQEQGFLATTASLLTDFDISINSALGRTKESLESFRKAAAQIVQGGVARAISGGIQNITQSLLDGENVFDNFGKFLLGTFGDLAIQLGSFFIAQGIAIEALNAVSGTGAIAAGAALIALGTILKSFSGGKGKSGSGSVGTGGGGSSPTEAGISTGTELASPEATQAAPQTNVSVNVTGFVNADKDELGRFIADTVTSNFERQGTRIIGANA